MSFDKFKVRGAAMLVVAVAALSGAATASAAPAVFSSTGQTNMIAFTPVTFTWGTTPTPGKTITCTAGAINVNTAAGSVNNLGSPLQGQIDFLHSVNVSTCGVGSGGSTWLRLTPLSRLVATKTGSSYNLELNNSAFDVWLSCCNLGGSTGAAISSSVPWTNGTGTGANSSKITFSSTLIGQSDYGEPVRMTGTFLVNSSSSGLLTLS